jgi:hypothetical protein
MPFSRGTWQNEIINSLRRKSLKGKNYKVKLREDSRIESWFRNRIDKVPNGSIPGNLSLYKYASQRSNSLNSLYYFKEE